MDIADATALPASRSPLSARAFGDHLLVGELIGRGGMSRVYRGWVRGTGHEVAVKVLRDDLAASPDAVQRFVRERELLQTVASRHVVRVHDLVVSGDEVAIVMDLVPGGHLRRAVTFPCDLGTAAELTAQIAEGLAAVHQAGVVHRDLKPENVLVERMPDGSDLLRLTDFGISRLVDSATLTQTTVTGTPGYLAPEVAAGAKVTAAADMYALGVLLYELCTGRQPFLADNPLLLVLAHTRNAPPRPIGMPDALWDVLSRLLAKAPLDRPPAADVARVMRGLAPQLAGSPPCTVPPQPPLEPLPPGSGAFDTAFNGAFDTAAGAPPTAAGMYAAAPPTAAVSGGYGPPAPPPLAGRAPVSPGIPPQSPRRGPDDYVVLEPGGPGLGSRRDNRQGAGRPSRPLPTPVLVGGAAALATVLVLGGMLALNLLRGPGADPEVRVGPAPSQQATGPAPARATTATSSNGAAPVRHGTTPSHVPVATLTTITEAPPTSQAPGPTTDSPPPTSPSTTTTTTPPPAVAPSTPTLDRVVRSADDKHASDKHATLAIGKVVAGTGTITRITVRFAAGQAVGTQDVAPNGDATDYEVTVNGLTNGTEYAFTVEVCNSADKCTTSDPLRFAPFGAPKVLSPKLTLGLAQKITVAIQPVTRRGNPGTTTCTLTVTGTPADVGAPTGQSVKSDGDTATFTGQPGTAYVASETCTTSDVIDGTATSQSLLVPAV